MGAPRAFVHQALIYSSGEEFVSAAVPFIQAGLARNEPVFVVTDPGKAALLSDALGDAAERVSFEDRSHWYQAPARRLSELYHLFRDHQEDGPGRIRVIGEPVWSGRSDAQIKEWKRFESLVNVACAPFPVLALCPYDARALPPSILADAYRTHPELVNGSTSEPNPEFVDPAAFIRELDEGEEEQREPETAGAQLSFHGDLAELRRFVVEQASRVGMGRKKLAELEWAANEIATNVVRHGGGEGTLRTWSVSGEFVCETVDRGPGIEDPLAGHLPADPDRELGPGLWLVHQLCDLVEVRSSASGSTVRLHIVLDEAAGPAEPRSQELAVRAKPS